MKRRQAILNFSAITGLSFVSPGDLFAKDVPNEPFTEATNILIQKIAEVKKQSKNPIEIWDDPTLHRFQRSGVYGFCKKEYDQGYHPFSYDWLLSEPYDSHLVLGQILNKYNGTIKKVYDGTRSVKSQGSNYMTNGYICGIVI